MAEVSRKRAKYDEEVPWSELPCPVLENIYSYLSRKDQSNMSVVCRKWSEAFESPSLWKRFHFHMSKSMISNNFSMTRFVRKYSRYFKHVCIHLDEKMEEENILICCQHLIIILQILTSTSQLDLFWFTVDCKCLNISTYENICIEIGDFLESQRNLKCVSFQYNYFEYKGGVKILKKAFINSKYSLKNIKLHDVFRYLDDNQQGSDVEEFLLTIFGLPNLSHLEIDYWLIFGKGQAILSDVVEKLRNCPKETILKIWVEVDDLIRIEDFKLLSSSEWRLLKKLYPLLEINMVVGSLSIAQKPPVFIIIEEIPITWLVYVFLFRYLNNSFSMEIDEFLNRLLVCKMNECLIFFCLVWLKSIPDMAFVFISFLKATKKLKSLVLETVYPVNVLDVFLDSLLNNRPESLEEFKLCIYDVENEHVKPLRKLCSRFIHRLKAVNINLELKIVEEPHPFITD